MSSWKLVEAEAEPKPAANNHGDSSQNYGGRGGRGQGRGNYANSNNQQGGGYQGRGRGGSGGYRGGRGGRGGRGYNNNYYQQPYIMTPADCVYFAFMAVQQIELIFMPDNLCMDTFIRSYMDVEGYVPIALLCSYPNVGGYNAPIANIIARLLETAATSRLEVDAPNETVRLKENWEMWLVPNQMGTKGQPRYIKQVIASSADGFVQGGEASNADAGNGFVEGGEASAGTGDAIATAAPDVSTNK